MSNFKEAMKLTKESTCTSKASPGARKKRDYQRTAPTNLDRPVQAPCKLLNKLAYLNKHISITKKNMHFSTSKVP